MNLTEQAVLSRVLMLRARGSRSEWHCYIPEHEEHDMMRPLVVT